MVKDLIWFGFFCCLFICLLFGFVVWGFLMRNLMLISYPLATLLVKENIPVLTVVQPPVKFDVCGIHATYFLALILLILK